jgi:hypothetical protein
MLIARGLVVFAASGACCMTTLAASADEAAPAQSELEAEEGIPLSEAPEWYRPHPWYGWKTLFVDAISFTLMFAAEEGDAAALGVIGLGGYVLGGPLIHLGHGEPLNGLGSFGLRLGLPAAGGLIGSTVPYDCSGFLCGWEPIGYGILIGMGAAVVLDAAFLGYRRGDDAASTTARLVPTFSLAGERTTLGVAGTF